MLRKKVKLFGRSVSLSVVLAAVIVTVAAAIWGISSVILDVSVTSSAANSVSAVSFECAVGVDDPTGTNETACSVVGSELIIEEASPGDVYVVVSYYSGGSTNSETMYAQPIDTSQWGSTLELIFDNGCGYAVNPGSTGGVMMQLQFDADGQDTSPSTGYGPFQITREFAATVPNCP
jgi:hypothetical protein